MVTICWNHSSNIWYRPNATALKPKYIYQARAWNFHVILHFMAYWWVMTQNAEITRRIPCCIHPLGGFYLDHKSEFSSSQLIYNAVVKYDLLPLLRHISRLNRSGFEEFNQMWEERNSMNIELFHIFTRKLRWMLLTGYVLLIGIIRSTSLSVEWKPLDTALLIQWVKLFFRNGICSTKAGTHGRGIISFGHFSTAVTPGLWPCKISTP